MVEVPFLRRVQEVLAEEFCQQGIAMRNLSEQVQQALQNAARRLAADIEFARQGSVETRG